MRATKKREKTCISDGGFYTSPAFFPSGRVGRLPRPRLSPSLRTTGHFWGKIPQRFPVS